MDIHDSTQKYAALFAALTPDNLTALEASLSEQVVKRKYQKIYKN